MVPHSDFRPQLPGWLWIPATGGVFLIVIPIIGLLAKVDWGTVGSVLLNPASLSAFRLSLFTASIATLASLLLGVPLATVLSYVRFRGHSALRTLVLLPLVLPPVVAGVALLYTFGRAGLVGPALNHAGISIAFTTVAVIIAQTFVSTPFVVLTLEAALNSRDGQLEKVATGLGASPTRTFVRVTVPTLRPALVSSAVLAFARALGEFGATVTFAGSLAGVTRTLPLEIYLHNESGNPQSALALSLVLTIIAYVVVLASYRKAKAG